MNKECIMVGLSVLSRIKKLELPLWKSISGKTGEVWVTQVRNPRVSKRVQVLVHKFNTTVDLVDLESPGGDDATFKIDNPLGIVEWVENHLT